MHRSVTCPSGSGKPTSSDTLPEGAYFPTRTVGRTVDDQDVGIATEEFDYSNSHRQLNGQIALINCYSGNPFLARLSHAIGSLLLEYNITPYINYVTSAENVADIFSRRDLELVGRRLAAK